ncbi:MAG TPA: arginine deiminase-related protein, partial [Alphaproteobacteria bacterium]|nr:arginine deiminase-related protein [Alphaproteobacteria bacterium]
PLPMSRQSTRHIMMMEPADFYANPQTFETNQYQDTAPTDLWTVHRDSVTEFRGLRDALVSHGTIVTTALGAKGSPDDIFVNNWVSTHAGRKMVLYPMLAENRRTERRPELLEILTESYELSLDLSACESEGRFLESTGSLCQDRVNRVAYAALSPRTNPDLAKLWCERMDFRLIPFRTRNHAGKPVYHTDVMMWIGTGVAGVCAECIVPEDRAVVLEALIRTHEVVEISMDQMRAFLGNALEVRGENDGRNIVMSSCAYRSLTEPQKNTILRHVDRIVHADIPTIERYGGGSARCMLLEMF